MPRLRRRGHRHWSDPRQKYRHYLERFEAAIRQGRLPLKVARGDFTQLLAAIDALGAHTSNEIIDAGTPADERK
jgi:hypothetical protein